MNFRRYLEGFFWRFLDNCIEDLTQQSEDLYYEVNNEVRLLVI